MANFRREFKESPWNQGENESKAYSWTTTTWASTPASVVVTLKDVTENGKDVSATNLSGSNSVAGDVITTKNVTGLTAGHRYRFEIQFQAGGNTYEGFGFIDAEE